MDLYDKKIMKLLIENCRYTITDIAKAVNLSKDSVKYRIKNLENENIITGYSTLFNPRKLGYVVTHLLLKLKNINIDEEKKIVEKLKKHKNVTFASTQSGVFDFQVIFHAKNTFHKNDIVKDLLNVFDGKVRDYKVVEHISDYNFSFLFNDVDVDISVKKKNDISFSKPLDKNKNLGIEIPKTIFEPSKSDKKIISELSKNPRMKLTQIGNKIGMSSEGVKKRIRNLIENKCIYKFTLYPNHEKLGYFNYMLMFKIESLPQKVENELKKFLVSNNFILYAANYVGEYNMFVYILAKNPSEFNQRFRKLRSIIDNYIIDYDLSIPTDIHKFVMISDDFFES